MEKKKKSIWTSKGFAADPVRFQRSICWKEQLKIIKNCNSGRLKCIIVLRKIYQKKLFLKGPR